MGKDFRLGIQYRFLVFRAIASRWTGIEPIYERLRTFTDSLQVLYGERGTNSAGWLTKILWAEILTAGGSRTRTQLRSYDTYSTARASAQLWNSYRASVSVECSRAGSCFPKTITTLPRVWIPPTEPSSGFWVLSVNQPNSVKQAQHLERQNVT